MTFKELYLEIFRRRGCSELEIARLKDELEAAWVDETGNEIFDSELIFSKGRTADDLISAFNGALDKMGNGNSKVLLFKRN